MTYTPIPAGTTQWHIPVNAAFTDLDDRLTATAYQQPSDASILAWNFDHRFANGQSTATAGTLFMARLEVLSAITATNLLLAVQTAGSTLTASQNFAGLYNSSGTRLAQTADQSGTWTSTDIKEMALTSPVAITAGTYYIGILANGTTPPQFVRTIGSSVLTSFANRGTTAATARWSIGGTALTALPASVTMGSRTFNAQCYWAAIS